MVLSKKSDIPRREIFLDGERLGQMDPFDYLGNLITSDCQCEKEIQRRVGSCQEGFHREKSILTDKKLNIILRLRLLKRYPWSTLLYGYGSWAISTKCRKKLEAVDMWCYQEMMRISWTKRILNEKVLDNVGVQRQLMVTVRQRHLRFARHVVRKGGWRNWW